MLRSATYSTNLVELWDQDSHVHVILTGPKVSNCDGKYTILAGLQICAKNKPIFQYLFFLIFWLWKNYIMCLIIIYIILLFCVFYLQISFYEGGHTFLLCVGHQTLSFGHCGPVSNKTGCAGWAREETATLCKRRRVVRGRLTHKGNGETVQESALKQNGFGLST